MSEFTGPPLPTVARLDMVSEGAYRKALERVAVLEAENRRLNKEAEDAAEKINRLCAEVGEARGVARTYWEYVGCIGGPLPWEKTDKSTEGGEG